ncbi:hypothetical protein Y590_15263 [Methylobacterium sp. AMS5]|nr:hypothetical protein Y590_15263 [Methylobacterium sp. AMS5]
MTGSAADCGEATRDAAPSKRCIAALRPAELVDTAETMDRPPCVPVAHHGKVKDIPQRNGGLIGSLDVPTWPQA